MPLKYRCVQAPSRLARNYNGYFVCSRSYELPSQILLFKKEEEETCCLEACTKTFQKILFVEAADIF